MPEESGLLSPPERWPTCFQENKALRSFLGKTGLKSRRVRLVTPATAAVPANVVLDPSDSFENATRLRSVLEWEVVRGFQVFGVAGQPDAFVAQKRWWNSTPEGTWVDLTPSAATCVAAGVVMAESDLAEKRDYSASAIVRSSDAAAAAATAAAAAAKQAAVAAEAARSAALKEAALEATRRRGAAADAAVAQVGVGRPSGRGTRLLGEWKVYGVRAGRLRMGFSPSGKWALEAQRWSSELEDVDTHDDFFEELDDDDLDAAQLQVKGRWEEQAGFVMLRVSSAEGVGPAQQYLPIKPEDVPTVARGQLSADGWAMDVELGKRSFRFEKA